jgi:branched-subunit amino acid transport protein
MIWLTIGGMAILTLAIRSSFLVFGQTLQFPAWLERALHYVPVAVLTALVLPMALAPQGRIELSAGNPYLLGALVSSLVAFYTRNTLLALLLSFMVYAALRALQ